MKLLITTRADSGVEEFCKISHPIFKKFAKKCNADFLKLDHISECKVGDGRWHFRIMKHYDLFEEYDRILHLDTDMIVLPSCPNLFEMVPYEKIGTIYEDKGSRKDHRMRCILAAQRKFGFIDWFGGYINTGTFLTSKCHKEIYQKINGEFWTDFGSDDVQLGYLIKKNNFQVMELPFQFNHMTMYSEAWNGFPNRFDSHIIHYAGRGIFDKSAKNKLEQMRADFKEIYG